MKRKDMEKSMNCTMLPMAPNETHEWAKRYHVFEKYRIESFRDWPFDETKSCNIKKMAEAGFYWCGTEGSIDVAACFLCGKELDGWESSDDPWLEHKRHAPQCAFSKMGRPEKKLTVGEFLTVLQSFGTTFLVGKQTDTLAKFKIDLEEIRRTIEKSFK